MMDYMDELKVGTDLTSIKGVAHNKSFTELGAMEFNQYLLSYEKVRHGIGA